LISSGKNGCRLPATDSTRLIDGRLGLAASIGGSVGKSGHKQDNKE
jgi:hypothetical protein